MKNVLKPLSLSVASMILFMVWCWFSMSGMDYYDGAQFYGYKTAGWFVLGMPFLIGFGILVSATIAFISRRIHISLGWAIAVLGFGYLIIQSVVSTLPNNRLAALLNLEPADLQITRLKQMDSHSDGTTTSAVMAGDEHLFDRICQLNNLQKTSGQTSMFFNWLNDGEPFASTPVTLFENKRLTCYNDSANQRIFIYHRSRSLPGEN